MRASRASTVAAIALLAVALGLGACGGPAGPPPRGVIEGDVGGWSFRRYQRLLDVEVWVKGDPAVAHSASYARRSAEKRGRLGRGDVVSAVVTRYGRDRGVARALVRFARRLARDASYRIEEDERGDVRLIEIAGGGEAWVMWAADRHIVKLGGPGVAEVPSALIEAYGERYPSRLGEGALEAPLPALTPDEGGETPRPAEPFDPDDPRPDWRPDGRDAPPPSGER